VNNNVKQPLPGQFRLRALFVLMALAAVAAWIMSWPLSLHLRALFLFLLWTGFGIWQSTQIRFPASPAQRVNAAVTEIVGQLILFAVFVIPSLTRSRTNWRVESIFIGLIAILVSLPIWRAIWTIRQAVAESRKTMSSQNSGVVANADAPRGRGG
jgi:hypothetical protein